MYNINSCFEMIRMPHVLDSVTQDCGGSSSCECCDQRGCVAWYICRLPQEHSELTEGFGAAYYEFETLMDTDAFIKQIHFMGGGAWMEIRKIAPTRITVQCRQLTQVIENSLLLPLKWGPFLNNPQGMTSGLIVANIRRTRVRVDTITFMESFTLGKTWDPTKESHMACNVNGCILVLNDTITSLKITLNSLYFRFDLDATLIYILKHYLGISGIPIYMCLGRIETQSVTTTSSVKRLIRMESLQFLCARKVAPKCMLHLSKQLRYAYKYQFQPLKHIGIPAIVVTDFSYKLHFDDMHYEFINETLNAWKVKYGYLWHPNTHRVSPQLPHTFQMGVDESCFY